MDDNTDKDAANVYEKKHVSDSFVLYSSTQQIVSILCAIIFLTLITILFFLKPYEVKYFTVTMNLYDLVVFALTFSGLSLLTGLFSHHATTVYVYEKFNIYYPNHWTRRFGSFFISIEIYGFLASIAIMLYAFGFVIISIMATVVFSTSWAFLIFNMRRVRRLESGK